MKKLFATLNCLKNKKVFKVTSGGDNGSTIIMSFGDEEYFLFIYCIWRLEQKEKILAGWNDPSNAKKGNLTIQTKKLTDEIVKNFSISNFYDLRIEFKSGKALNIFCDITPQFQVKGYDVNWSFCEVKKNICYNIDRNFKIETEKFF
ncbi:MAG: hypothetical protein WC223_04375 [Bacteroidales bacterium]|jgi:hypothetical protein